MNQGTSNKRIQLEIVNIVSCLTATIMAGQVLTLRVLTLIASVLPNPLIDSVTEGCVNCL